MPLAGDGPEADRLAERFAQAVAACRKRHEMGALLAETRERLPRSSSEAESLPSNDDAGAAAPLAVAHPRGARPHRRARRARCARSPISPHGSPRSTRRSPPATPPRRERARQGTAGRRRPARPAGRAREARLRSGDDHAARRRSADARHRRRPRGPRQDRIVARDRRRRRRLRKLQEQVAPRVRELREMDDWRRFANAQRQEQLIAMAEAIVESLKADEEADQDDGPRGDRARAEGAAREVAGSRRGAAQVGAAAVGSLPHRHRLHPQPLRALFQKHARRARRQPRTQDVDRRRSRGAGGVGGLGEGDVAVPGTAEGVAGARPGAARCRPRAGAAVPHGVQHVLRAPPRGSRVAQEGLGGQPRQEGSALRARRSAGRVHRLGQRRRPS